MAAIHPDATAAGPPPLAEGDAIQHLFDRYSPQLLRFCRARLGSLEEAEDALQLTYLYALLALRRGVTPTFESAWLYTIAGNVCLSRGRSAGRRGRIEVTADTEQLNVPCPEADTTELFGLDEALAAIPERQRQAILMREWQGLSYKEIADELDISQSAVETLIFRARRSLATALEYGGRLPRASVLAFFDLGSLLNGAKALFGAPAFQGAAAVALSASVLTTLPSDQQRPSRAEEPPRSASPLVVSNEDAPGLGIVLPRTGGAPTELAQRPRRLAEAGSGPAQPKNTTPAPTEPTPAGQAPSPDTEPSLRGELPAVDPGAILPDLDSEAILPNVGPGAVLPHVGSGEIVPNVKGSLEEDLLAPELPGIHLPTGTGRRL